MSKRVFNSIHRIDLALAARRLADSGFDLEELVDELQVSRSAVHRDLKLFVEIGALAQMTVDRRVIYTVLEESPFWALIDVLDDRAIGVDKEVVAVHQRTR